MGKTTLFRISLMLAISSCLVSLKGAEECPDAIQVTGCNYGQSEGFTVVKVFQVKLESVAKEMSYVFSQGTEYQITVSGPDGKMVPLHVTLFDESHHMLLHNFDKKSKNLVQRMNYLCGHTAADQLRLEPEKGSTGCAYVFISFRPI